MSSSRPKVVLVMRAGIVRDDGRFLIIRRSPNDRHNAGLWEWPGGKVDERQDVSRAFEREVLEETQLVVEPQHRLVSYEQFIIEEGPYKGLLYLALFAVTRLVGGVLKLSDEHTEHAWVTYDEMLKYDLTHEVRKAAIILNASLQSA